MDRVVIVGCGDIGRRVGRLACAQGAEVVALARSDDKAGLLENEGFHAWVGDLNDPSMLPDLPVKKSTVFYLAPPPGGGFQDPRTRHFCKVFSEKPPRRLVYLGTSGVYGDCGDRAVTEGDPVSPVTSRARRRLDAEQCLCAWGEERGVEVMRVRVANIYGPGRLPVAHIKAGHPLLREDQSPPTSRVHSDDLARALWAVAAAGRGGQIFNVSDAEPCSMTKFFKAVAHLTGIPVPEEVDLERAREVMKPLLLNYFTESRILNSQKIVNELGFKWQYPTLKEGLPASI